MKELASQYLHLMPDVSTPKDPQVPFYSSVTCQKISHGAELGTQYWVDNLTSPVRFSTAVDKILLEPGRKTFVEIGPHSSLAGPVRQILKAANATNAEYTSVLARGQDSHASLLRALGELWSSNHSLDLGAIFGADGGTFLPDLPLYPWHYEGGLWNESRLAREWRLREFPHHDILGSRVLESTDHAPSWRNLLRLDVVPWIKDHEIAGDIVFPGVGYIAMAGEAVRQLTTGGVGDFTARRVHIKTAMILTQDTAALEVVTQLHRIPLTSSSESNWYSFSISSNQNGGWLKHASGEVRAGQGPERGLNTAPPEITPLPRLASAKSWYRKFRSMGIEYGPRFIGLRDITAGTQEEAQLVASVTNDVREGESPYAIHPATLDCVLQAVAPAVSRGLTRRMGAVGIPSYIGEMYVRPPATPEMTMRVTASESPRNAYIGDAVAVSGGELVVRVEGVQMSFIGDSGGDEEDLHAAVELEWKEDINLMDPAPLIRQAKDRREVHGLLDKFAAVCMLETSHRLAGTITNRAHLEKYRDWLNSITAEITAGTYLSLGEDGKAASMDLTSRENTIASLHAQLMQTEAHAAAEAIHRITQNCVSIFDGTTDVLALLLEGNVLHDLYDFMQNSDYTTFLDLEAHKKPNLRVLEIGAGTGGTTATLLPALQSAYGERMYSSYTYTDVSAGFFPAARERFRGYAAVEYAVLDISRAPLEQGFEPESFDFIVACNVSPPQPWEFQNLISGVLSVRRHRCALLISHDRRFFTPRPSSMRLYRTFAGYYILVANSSYRSCLPVSLSKNLPLAPK